MILGELDCVSWHWQLHLLSYNIVLYITSRHLLQLCVGNFEMENAPGFCETIMDPRMSKLVPFPQKVGLLKPLFIVEFLVLHIHS